MNDAQCLVSSPNQPTAARCVRRRSKPGWAFRAIVTAALLPALLLTACRGNSPSEKEQAQITVAAAANLNEAFQEMAKQFTKETGIKVVYSFGATGNLTKQIENKAPFDVFAAADTSHVEELDKQGLLVDGSRAVYTIGKLVLWTPPKSTANISRVEDVAKPEIKRIAVANPELAPYGKATVETLESLKIWPQVQGKVVYGENVSGTKQFASTGNADAAFIPLALVKPGEGKYIEIDESLHKPIAQALGVIKASHNQEAARRFAQYVLGNEGQSLMRQYGYASPSR